MLGHSSPTSRENNHPLPWRRWVVIVVAAIILHLIVLEWANEHIGMASRHEEAPIAVTMVPLRPPVLPAAPVKTTAKPKFKPAARPHPHIVQQTPPVVTTPIQQPDTKPADDAALTADSSAATKTDNNVDEKQTVDKPATVDGKTEAKTDAPSEKPAAPHYTIDLPPPVELKYEVKRVAIEGKPEYGASSISWQHDDGHYKIEGEAHVTIMFEINLFKFDSEGKLDDYGIAPATYAQKSRNRSETNTHFNRDERNSISFSSGKLSLPRLEGAQDRASIPWELASIGRGDKGKFIPGAQIDLFVAGDRDGEIWSIQVIGKEEIETGLGKTQVWHVVRKLTGTYDRTIDIWLSPQYEWYPVRIRQTEKNGEYIDMTMSSLHKLPPANSQTGSAS